jgi:hypothetical protein
MSKPSIDTVLDKLDDALKDTVGESWEMNNIEIEDGGCYLTISFWDCATADEEEELAN